MTEKRLTRRTFVATATAASAVTLSAPFVRRANAAGTLNVGLWDHWVPGANDACTKLIKEWSDKEKVEVKIDYITSQGNKLLLTIAAEAQARSGHDVIMLNNWLPSEHKNLLEPLDDVMAKLIKEYGAVDPAIESFGRPDGVWTGVPSIRGTLSYACCTRMDLLKQHAGIDVQAMYPAGKDPVPELVDKWTYDAFLDAAEKCKKAGVPFGLPMGQTGDTVQWVGALFTAFGAELADVKGNITVKSDAVKQVLDYSKRLIAALPDEVGSWDDASNNKWLVSGRGALILNPPSAWAVAKRDAPDIAKQIWHHGMPKGPKGRFIATTGQYLSVWKFGKNKEAAKSLIHHMSTKEAAEKLVTASKGYDLPSFPTMRGFKTWDEQEPPLGTTSHYPSKGDQKFSMAAAPAPAAIAQQIYSQALQPKMMLRVAQGEAIDKVIDWAAGELEGYTRR